ncbi:hypothetical protein M413DRAFT_291726 [Hebeloma cylindrosporum]|uniref:DUF6535 domain-containing protein n=1 Tax=Hebeloma cylindrosporum TaxID=76867 RepID=A0A0C3BY17_HEBCY|nr:hypothetical protein M413DRAFT_291726 [Hebeloma cylindrosporum h7]
MRKEALEAWYVPQIFAGLPLLLQGALALYLAGLIDYLLGFGLGVAIPGIIFITLSLFFLVATTVLPTLQGLIVLPTYLENTHSLPSPCAYKSPQSQAFRRLITTFRRSFLAIRWLIAQVQWLVMRFREHLYRFIQLESSQPRFVRTSRWFPSVLPVWHQASWIDFDRSWLSFHDCMFLNIADARLLDNFYRPPKPLYDALKGIRSIARGNEINPSERYLFAQFHFLHDIFSSVAGDSPNMLSPRSYLDTYFQLLQKSPNDPDQKPSLLSQMLAEPSFDSHLLFEENTLAILDIIDPTHQLSPTLSKHFVECNLRLMAAIYSKTRPLHQGSDSPNLPHWIPPFALGAAIENIKTGENITGAKFKKLFRYMVLNQSHPLRFKISCTNGRFPSTISSWPLSIPPRMTLSYYKLSMRTLLSGGISMDSCTNFIIIQTRKPISIQKSCQSSSPRSLRYPQL